MKGKKTRAQNCANLCEAQFMTFLISINKSIATTSMFNEKLVHNIYNILFYLSNIITSCIKKTNLSR